MEIYSFDIKNFETRLDEIRCFIDILYLSIYGLSVIEVNGREEISALIHFISEASSKIDIIIESMKPISIREEEVKRVLKAIEKIKKE